MNLSIRKGTYPTYSPDIGFVNSSGQYTITAAVANNSTTQTVYSQVLFYWAAAVLPTASPQLYGWSLGAYIQPLAPASSNPAPAGAGTPILPNTPPGIVSNSTIWVPDSNVISTISSSAAPSNIMIIAQVIQVSPSPTGKPTDFQWWSGTNTWVGAAIFPISY
jgi:hypothetical protein